jgi:hypothetical protein
MILSVISIRSSQAPVVQRLPAGSAVSARFRKSSPENARKTAERRHPIAGSHRFAHQATSGWPAREAAKPRLPDR